MSRMAEVAHTIEPFGHQPEPSDEEIAVERTASALWMHGQDLAVLAIEKPEQFSETVMDDIDSTITRLQFIASVIAIRKG